MAHFSAVALHSLADCTDVAKAVDAPIFHVNGDDVEAVARVMDIAVEWRQTFGTDVVVDIVCYRRFGHNETDQPKFTQPLMYQRIEKQKKTIDIYSEILVSDGVVTPEWVKENEVAFDAGLEETFASASEYDPETDEEMKLFWEGTTPWTLLLDCFSRISQLYNTPYAPCDTL